MRHKDFGDFLRGLRENAKMEIDFAALRLVLDVPQLSALEAGHILPSEQTLDLISLLYMIPYRELREVWEAEKKRNPAG